VGTGRKPQPGARHLRAQERLARELSKIGFVLPGSLINRSTSCGKPGCKCQADPPQLHGPYWEWTRKVSGKTQTRRLSDAEAARYKPWFDNRRRLRELVADLQELSLDVFESDRDEAGDR
jgi:hypothetical protein